MLISGVQGYKGARRTALGEWYKVQGIFNLGDIQNQNSVFITLCAMPFALCAIFPTSAFRLPSPSLDISHCGINSLYNNFNVWYTIVIHPVLLASSSDGSCYQL
jgi:hypothetical protein